MPRESKVHMFHEEDPSALRFEITSAGGGVVIRVLPKRAATGGRFHIDRVDTFNSYFSQVSVLCVIAHVYLPR